VKLVADTLHAGCEGGCEGELQGGNEGGSDDSLDVRLEGEAGRLSARVVAAQMHARRPLHKLAMHPAPRHCALVSQSLSGGAASPKV